ncbi:MAG: hypothetical protein JWP44_2607, partial [Mucilaginibacter sp.]|nr:hypothetical protein [Mucilaginibacter sp.]
LVMIVSLAIHDQILRFKVNAVFFRKLGMIVYTYLAPHRMTFSMAFI